MIQFYVVIVTGTMNLNAILGSANKLINSSATRSLVHPTMSHAIFVIKIVSFCVFFVLEIDQIRSTEQRNAAGIQNELIPIAIKSRYEMNNTVTDLYRRLQVKSTHRFIRLYNLH